jgi:hypothetical protein
MAKCGWCRQEMLEADECKENYIVEYPNYGGTLSSIRYGDETRYGDDFAKDYKSDKRCHDCNVLLNNYHHPGCDMEECPKCCRQLISCGCLDDSEETL